MRYYDHVLFREADASQYKPWARETIGRLDYEDENSVRIIWEWFAEPDPTGTAKTPSSGLALLKRAIIEMRKIG